MRLFQRLAFGHPDTNLFTQSWRQDALAPQAQKRSTTIANATTVSSNSGIMGQPPA